ncbi:MAG TPA: AAA family ATPase [Bacillota bacterium]|nr:AAA family ATPase [Bacillota bacterium]
MGSISLPRTTLLVLCGPPGCGKSTFASRFFKDTETVSSDKCRLLVSDSEASIGASKEAFKLFYHIIERRLSLGRFTAADSTAVTRRARTRLLNMGRKHGFHVALLIFNIPEEVCMLQNKGRDRRVILPVIARMQKMLRHTLKVAGDEGFDQVQVLSEENLNDPAFKIEILNHVVSLPGPFDIIGDIHGCCGELETLHGGIKEEMIGKVNGRVRNFCLFGDATGEVTDEGLPVQRDWAGEYRGNALIVYGHTPVPEAKFINNTINIDQGCVMGGKLTALRYPEREIVQVPALAAYYERAGSSKAVAAGEKNTAAAEGLPTLHGR